MKRTTLGLAAGVALVAALSVPSITLAVTPTVEPSLPQNIVTDWKQIVEVTCDQNVGKLLMLKEYVSEDVDMLKFVTIMTMNGQKVLQIEATMTPGKLSSVIYVKSSPQGNWLKYDKSERGEANTRFFVELGLTEEQFQPCGRPALNGVFFN